MRHLTKNVTTRLAIALRRRILLWGLLGGLVVIPCHSAMAQCTSTSLLKDGDFAGQSSGGVRKPWYAEGKAGIDHVDRGDNKAWVRNNTGWNALRQTVRLSAGVHYILKARVHTSGNVRDGYFGFRDASQHPVSEIKFGPLTSYRELRVEFRPTRTDIYNVFIGVWAPNQDAWTEVDYVRLEPPLSSPCNDVILNPANN